MRTAGDPSRRFTCRRWIAAAANVALPARGGRARATFATVEKAAGVAGLADGSRLRGVSIDLRGTVLVTARGARIVIEAPASSVRIARRLRMQCGRLSADVPPAARASPSSPRRRAWIWALRVDVPLGGAAEVHVFRTVITRQSGAREQQNLRGGDAVTFNQGAARRAACALPHSFSRTRCVNSA